MDLQGNTQFLTNEGKDIAILENENTLSDEESVTWHHQNTLNFRFLRLWSKKNNPF